MPKKLERCVTDVIKTGKSKGAAYAICNATLNKSKKKGKK
jgi:hypothetical protein